MSVIESIRTALQGLAANKLRAALTMLGIIIGVAAVIAMVAVGSGAQARIQEQIASIGSNIIVVISGSITSSGIRMGTGAAQTLSEEDARAIARDCPAVQAAAVVAKPDEKWGETPCAFVELKPGQSATADELMAWCRKNLAGYKCPRTVVFVELPKTSTGKIQKFKLREMAKNA